jgi:hypothetical protein
MIVTFSLLAKNPVAPAVKREADDWGGSVFHLGLNLHHQKTLHALFRRLWDGKVYR